MGFDLTAVMTEAGTLLKAVRGLRVFDYEVPRAPGGVTAVVGYPEEIRYNQQYGPEGFRLDLPIVILAPNPTERRTRDVLSKYTATSGDYSLKLALEKPATYTPGWSGYTSFDEATLTSVTFDNVIMNNVTYAGALCIVDIFGS